MFYYYVYIHSKFQTHNSHDYMTITNPRLASSAMSSDDLTTIRNYFNCQRKKLLDAIHNP